MLPPTQIPWVSTLNLDLRLVEVLDWDEGKVINSKRTAGIDLNIVQVIDPGRAEYDMGHRLGAGGGGKI